MRLNCQLTTRWAATAGRPATTPVDVSARGICAQKPAVTTATSSEASLLEEVNSCHWAGPQPKTGYIPTSMAMQVMQPSANQERGGGQALRITAAAPTAPPPGLVPYHLCR